MRKPQRGLSVVVAALVFAAMLPVEAQQCTPRSRSFAESIASAGWHIVSIDMDFLHVNAGPAFDLVHYQYGTYTGADIGLSHFSWVEYLGICGPQFQPLNNLQYSPAPLSTPIGSSGSSTTNSKPTSDSQTPMRIDFGRERMRTQPLAPGQYRIKTPTAVDGVRGVPDVGVAPEGSAGWTQAAGVLLGDAGGLSLASYGVTFPASISESYFRFAFAFQAIGDGDYLRVSLGNQDVWSRPATDFVISTMYYGFIPKASLVGQSSTLSYILNGIGTPDSRVVIVDESTIVDSPGPATSAYTISTIGGGVSDNVPGVSTGLGAPKGIAVGGTDIFFTSALSSGAYRTDAAGQLWRVAGNGSPYFNQNDRVATSLALNSPVGVAVDAANNVFVADQANHRIRRVDAVTGLLSTVAGSGSRGFGGDGAAATAAFLTGPTGVLVTSVGDMYIADRENHRVRFVDHTTGNISTVAGNGTAGFGGDIGPATGAQLNLPSAVALDGSGNLLIADEGNNRIRRVSGGTITTVAGDGTAAVLNAPTAVLPDGSGNVYVADRGNHRVRYAVPMGAITTVAGTGMAGFSGEGGPATSAQLASPSALAFDGSGNLLIVDEGNHRIRRIVGGNISTIAGNGTAGFSGTAPAPLGGPQNVAVDSMGNVFVGDRLNHMVRRIDAISGVTTVVAGTGVAGFNGDAQAPTSATLSFPAGVAVEASGNLFVADEGNHRIRYVNFGTNQISTYAGTGTASFSGDGMLATLATINRPEVVALDVAGNVYIADSGNHRIRKVNASDKKISTVAGNGGSGPPADAGSALMSSFLEIAGIAVDATGIVFVSDSVANRIMKIAGGSISRYAGDGVPDFAGDEAPAISARFKTPSGLGLDSWGNLYVADLDNQRIRRIDALGGVVATVAGIGAKGWFGDGEGAFAARLSSPSGVAVDSNGRVAVADRGNNRIRLLTPVPADLSVSISLMGTAMQGAPASYQVTVTNGGPTTVTGVDLGRTLSPAFGSPVYSPSIGTFDSATGGWGGLSLATGQAATMTISGTVNANATGMLTSTVFTWLPMSEATDLNYANNSATSSASIACATFGGNSIAVMGATTICPGGMGGTATVSYTSGGVVAHQWGFRTMSGGTITPIASQTSASYLLSATDFGMPGSYFLVCTTTPQCGSVATSNEVGVIVGDSVAPTVTAPAAVKVTQTLCQ